MAGMIQSMSEEERLQAKVNLEKRFNERKDPGLGGILGVGIVATGRKRGG